MSIKFVSVQDELPPRQKFRDSIQIIVRIQEIQGGCLSNNIVYEVARFGSTMDSPNYFWIKANGIVTHWAYFDTLEQEEN